MKTRNGFVSNSSSSSFILILPDEFDLGLYFPQYLEYLEEESDEDGNKMTLKKFQKLDKIDEYDNNSLFEFFHREIKDEIKKYEFESWDTSSDAGEIFIKRVSEVNKFMSGENFVKDEEE